MNNSSSRSINPDHLFFQIVRDKVLFSYLLECGRLDFCSLGYLCKIGRWDIFDQKIDRFLTDKYNSNSLIDFRYKYNGLLLFLIRNTSLERFKKVSKLFPLFHFKDKSKQRDLLKSCLKLSLSDPLQGLESFTYFIKQFDKQLDKKSLGPVFEDIALYGNIDAFQSIYNHLEKFKLDKYLGTIANWLKVALEKDRLEFCYYLIENVIKPWSGAQEGGVKPNISIAVSVDPPKEIVNLLGGTRVHLVKENPKTSDQNQDLKRAILKGEIETINTLYSQLENKKSIKVDLTSYANLDTLKFMYEKLNYLSVKETAVNSNVEYVKYLHGQGFKFSSDIFGSSLPVIEYILENVDPNQITLKNLNYLKSNDTKSIELLYKAFGARIMKLDFFFSFIHDDSVPIVEFYMKNGKFEITPYLLSQVILSPKVFKYLLSFIKVPVSIAQNIVKQYTDKKVFTMIESSHYEAVETFNEFTKSNILLHSVVGKDLPSLAMETLFGTKVSEPKMLNLLVKQYTIESPPCQTMQSILKTILYECIKHAKTTSIQIITKTLSYCSSKQHCTIDLTFNSLNFGIIDKSILLSIDYLSKFVIIGLIKQHENDPLFLRSMVGNIKDHQILLDVFYFAKGKKIITILNHFSKLNIQFNEEIFQQYIKANEKQHTYQSTKTKSVNIDSTLLKNPDYFINNNLYVADELKGYK
ncbi:hypothetical protein CYY_006099 [Polysphondylium violaceum]|uniref:Uncharacterized protein n=1 Tax=Polysphondylium violaceum TaxID=133409 RepID=A0A8J4PST1_9MYCE|nr:hypothetical protein CYY_006099 [Polysphondylium violaceum]